MGDVTREKALEAALREAAKQLRIIAGMDLMGASAVAYNAARDAEAAFAAPATAQGGTRCDRVWFDGAGEWFTAEEVERHGTDGLREFVAVDSLPATAQGVDVASEGPQPLPVEYTCTGCPHLATEEWEFFGENDEIDRGVDAECKKAGKSIASYWRNGNRPPLWCPFALPPPAQEPPPEAERPDGYECLAQNIYGTWKHVRWQWGRWTIKGDQTSAIHKPEAFAPLPPASEARDE